MNKSENATVSLSYEAAVNRLEQIVQLLEEENLSLDQTIELYDEGAKLVIQCTELLNKAELKVKTITEGMQRTTDLKTLIEPIKSGGEE